MVAIILVNWNGCLDTIECLESLLRMTDQGFVVFIVDNRSSDNSVQVLTQWAAEPPGTREIDGPWSRLPKARVRDPDLVRMRAHDPAPPLSRANIVLIESNQNLGFAGANNLAVAVARSIGPFSHYWFLNNDTIVAPDCLSQLNAFARQDKSLGLIGARLMFYGEPDIVQGVGGFFIPWKARAGHLGARMKVQDLPDRHEIEARTQYVMGASLFLTTDVALQLGPMSQDYFLYFEELDWAKKLRSDQKLGLCLDAIVYHKEGASIGTSSVSRPSDTSLYYLNTNLIRFMWTYHRPLSWIAILRVFREMLKYVAPLDRNALKSLFAAITDRLRGHNRTGPIRW